MGFLPVAWRKQLARERCAIDLLDGETLDAANGIRLPHRRLRRSGLMVDIRPSAAVRGKEKEREQGCAECLGAEDTPLEDGERYGVRADRQARGINTAFAKGWRSRDGKHKGEGKRRRDTMCGRNGVDV